MSVISDAREARSATPEAVRSLGARLIPVTLTCYQVAVGDQVRGYLCCTSEGWECCAGRALDTAEDLGVRRTLLEAVRTVMG
ncbi:hypothetical protein [Microbacterium sp. JZ37]|uniref:hypothetical protein n=1 Tax=Microbacterium sp. JZ37 TaxID=2654193 RepID=UPI002B48CC9E|nr:hypothetical protein [Microbacterium sp. JZ37]WRH18758.1 hypothetical protein GC092_15365 [Microbacterium sp. JZ37]